VSNPHCNLLANTILMQYIMFAWSIVSLCLVSSDYLFNIVFLMVSYMFVIFYNDIIYWCYMLGDCIIKVVIVALTWRRASEW
jgi:hypothetical protein